MRRGAARRSRVDLRERGGACKPHLGCGDVEGRSPRARRSPRPRAPHTPAHGSISASAEEPRAGVCSAPCVRVDLRERGGAELTGRWPVFYSGRSPRARRSRVGRRAVRQRPGSISASAEEPDSAHSDSTPNGVDLRERGGARCVQRTENSESGRSPRARRSRASFEGAAYLRGSISASAEEPVARSRSFRSWRVDLRERGGASEAEHGRGLARGRSPRARRSRRLSLVVFWAPGSISASAEEPCLSPDRSTTPWVDLRERGGAVLQRDH